MSEIEIELEAMKTISTALEPLEDDAQGRVLEWAVKKFNFEARRPAETAVGSANVEAQQFTEFVDLFDAANPTTEQERCLVGAHWLQESRQEGTFTSERVNTLLKDMGRGVSNITKTLTRLQQTNPALVRQVAKSGRSRQARKTYKLTTAGVREVLQMTQQREGT